LIAALRNALKDYSNIIWAKFCEEESQVCSAFTTSYCERTIRDWWQEFKKNIASHTQEDQMVISKNTIFGRQ
jgi:hypothetical protein